MAAVGVCLPPFLLQKPQQMGSVKALLQVTAPRLAGTALVLLRWVPTHLTTAAGMHCLGSAGTSHAPLRGCREVVIFTDQSAYVLL